MTKAGTVYESIRMNHVFAMYSNKIFLKKPLPTNHIAVARIEIFDFYTTLNGIVYVTASLSLSVQMPFRQRATHI